MNAAHVNLIERIEAQCNDKRLCAGDLAENILELIQASKASPPSCSGCNDLRGRLVNIYHLTLTYLDAPTALLAVRAASGPGAPAPAPRDLHITPAALGLEPPRRSNA